MIVGALRLELAIYESRSLKDKRQAIKSLKERIGQRFHVSVAEVDRWQWIKAAVLGVAMVSNDATHVHECLDRIVDFIRTQPRVQLLDYERQLW
jgi:uncharacterized protein YlxP (DUF503 family)